MNRNKTDQIREKISRHIQHTLNYCLNVTYEEFHSNQMLQEACIFNVLQVGELAAKAIEYGLDEEYPGIEWRQMRGMRNRIVHDYAGLDSFIVYNTIKNDLDPLKETFVKIIHEGLVNRSFDEGEFEAAKNSGFYKFIDFNIF